jgi:hypothetical protein
MIDNTYLAYNGNSSSSMKVLLLFEISNTRPSNQEFELQIGSGIEEL